MKSAHHITHAYIHVTILFASTLFLFCTHNESFVKAYSTDITTNGFIDNNCFQCIVTAKPDPGLEGLVASRESAHINLMMTIEQQCYNELIAALAHFNTLYMSDSNVRQCLMKKLKPYVDNRVIVVTYYNEDFSKTAVVRIYKKGLRETLLSLRCQ